MRTRKLGLVLIRLQRAINHMTQSHDAQDLVKAVCYNNNFMETTLTRHGSIDCRLVIIQRKLYSVKEAYRHRAPINFTTTTSRSTWSPWAASISMVPPISS